MIWEYLGTLNPGVEWQFFLIPVSDCEIFKIEQSDHNSVMRGWGYIAQSFEPPDILNPRRIYPGPENLIIELSIPHQLRELGYISRYIGARISSTAQLADLNWALRIYKLI